MTFEILRKQPIKFYKQNGVSFFEPFKAIDNYKKPLEVSWYHKTDSSSIIASTDKDNLSIYNMELNHNDNSLRGLSIVANPRNRGIGELLNLASLITFKENNLSDYSVFVLRDAIQFYTKYGFNILSSNINEIIHNLKFLAKSKRVEYADMKDSAKYYLKKIEHGSDKEKQQYIPLSNNLVSDYIRNLTRKGQKIDGDDLYNHTHMHFSTIDTIRNKDYLNELLDKHEIDYKI